MGDGRGEDMTSLKDMDRLDDLEMGLMLFMGILTGQPENATEAEKEAAMALLTSIMERIQKRQCKV